MSYSYHTEEEPCGTTSSEDGEQEPCKTAGWEVWLVWHLFMGGCISFIILVGRLCKVRDYCYWAQWRGRRGASCPGNCLAGILVWLVVAALWPICLVDLCCPCWWDIPAAGINGMVNFIHKRLTRVQEHEATDTSRTDNSHWHRRGWLILLRARHQPIAASPVSSKGRWAGFCRKQNGLPMRDVPLSREEDDIEGGQQSVAKGIAASRFRQLLMRVVEHEEDGVFRSIVGYL